ncbi:acyltransferase family protein [Brachybacterium sp. AOP43-C2-M15]|uniref:acyltransferase family protein n=1 Tax=Brachybacterium sp. AOP43-C2-M15 TaxID=3457661 RepID=UPI00403326A2
MTSHPALTSSPPGPAGTASRAAPRSHHLDALRGGALLLGVLLHALMPFFPGGLWLVDDQADSWGAVGTVAVIHLFRMVLFMMLAGYFGRMVLQRRGAGRYLRDRTLRIGLPLIVFWPVLFALVVLAMVLNEVHGMGTPTAPAGSSEPSGLLSLPTLHLWFLLLLFEIVVVVVVLRAPLVRMLGARRSERIARRIGAMLSTPWGLLLLAIPYAGGLLLQDDTSTSLTEPYTLIPVAGASVGYAGAFLAGWFLRADPEALPRIERRWVVHLVLAIVLSPAALASEGAVPALVSAGLTALAGWAWVLALLGLSARLVRREIGWVRYLADASYWVYLMHFPLLLLIAVPLSGLALPILVKLVISLAVVMVVLLLSYDLLVRSTWLGKWLNGHRRPRALGPERRIAPAETTS